MKKWLILLMIFGASLTLNGCTKGSNKTVSSESSTSSKQVEKSMKDTINLAKKAYDKGDITETKKILKNYKPKNNDENQALKNEEKSIDLYIESKKSFDSKDYEATKLKLKSFNFDKNKNVIAFSNLKTLNEQTDKALIVPDILDDKDNHFMANWSQEGAGESKSNISITIDLRAKHPVQIDGSKLSLEYDKKENGYDKIESNNHEVKIVKPGESVTFKNVFNGFSDQHALYGFSVSYKDFGLIHEESRAEQKPKDSNNLTTEDMNNGGDTQYKALLYYGIHNTGLSSWKSVGSFIQQFPGAKMNLKSESGGLPGPFTVIPDQAGSTGAMFVYMSPKEGRPEAAYDFGQKNSMTDDDDTTWNTPVSETEVIDYINQNGGKSAIESFNVEVH